jgi:hypothetical protein
MKNVRGTRSKYAIRHPNHWKETHELGDAILDNDFK